VQRVPKVGADCDCIHPVELAVTPVWVSAHTIEFEFEDRGSATPPIWRSAVYLDRPPGDRRSGSFPDFNGIRNFASLCSRDQEGTGLRAGGEHMS